MSASRLVKGFEDECMKFRALDDGQCRKLSDHIKAALLVVIKDADDRAAVESESDPARLRDEWVDVIQAEIKQISAHTAALTRSFDPDSFVGTFIRSAPKKETSKSTAHPRGEKKSSGWSSDEPPELIEVSDSDSSSSDSYSSSTEDEDPPEKEAPSPTGHHGGGCRKRPPP